MNHENIQKTGIYPIGLESKQIKETKASSGRSKGVIEPDDSFDDLIVGHDNSFAVGGIADKVASGADSGFADFQVDEGLDTKDAKSLKNFLDSIDVYMLFLELFVVGNSFFEIVKGSGNKEKVVRAERFLVDTLRITTIKTEQDAKDGNVPHSFVQKDNMDEVPFDYRSVLHFKTPNMRSKYYGKSKFYKCVDQVVLLGQIDKFYSILLDKGNIKTKLLIDESGKLNTQQKEAIKSVINDAMRGVDDGFKTAIVPGVLKTLDLQDDTETDAFLEYRRDLIKSVCVGCNFPYDLLISDNSNRATVEVAKELLNENLVVPLQNIVLRQLKEHLKSLDIRSDEIIEKIAFNPVDVSNEKEQMEVITGYKKTGVIDANEARSLSPYNLQEREDGGELTTVQDNKDKNAQNIEKTIKGRYNAETLHSIQKKNVQ